MTPDEQRGYSKGYAAGQRRAKREHAAEVMDAVREDFIQRMMIAIAPQIIASPWGKTVDGKWKAHKGAVEIMGCVRNVAVEAAKQCSFTVLAEPEQDQ